MKFAIRDDDTNFFTNPEDLEKIYSRIWNICPISLAVVPFIASMKSPAIPEKYWQEDKIFPIGENSELVSYLREKIKEEKISIMLHGYSHKDNPDGYEFETGNNLYQKLRKGKEYLEEVFRVEVNTFVPPHNTILKEGIKAVTKTRMNLSVVPSFRFNKRPWAFRTFRVALKRHLFRIKYGLEMPYVLDFGTHKEIKCYPLTPQVNFEFLKGKFDFIYKFEGIFCLTTHYWEFKAKMKNEQEKTQREVFEKFWNYVRLGNKIEFSSLDKILGEG